MVWRAGRALAVATLIALCGGGIASSVSQQIDPGLRGTYVFDLPDRPTEAWRLAYGGRLYDRWWAVLHAGPPQRTHPAYPAGGGQSGATTWRCVACHGWDYAGSDRAFIDKEPRIKGVRALTGVDPDQIVAVMRDAVHGYDAAMIPNDAARALALFVAAGQGDPDRYIDRATRRAHGDADSGRAVYQNTCAACHQFDGRAPIFGEETDDLRTLGAIAASNPWRALHKIRNGQPGADMLAMRAFDLSVALDVLAYVQTLPRE